MIISEYIIVPLQVHGALIQGDRLSGKFSNVRDFDSCRGNVRDFTKKVGKSEGKNLVREKWPKFLAAYLHVYRYLVASIF